MKRRLTILIADLTDPSHPFHGPSADYAIRSVSKNDIPRLAALYFASYDPGVACVTLEAALVDIRASFAGDYGILRPEASPVVVCEGEIVAALITVHRAAWSDTPNCPFIIELFTDCAPRRCGSGRALLVACFAAVPNGGHASSALQVEADNHPALSLYASGGGVDTSSSVLSVSHRFRLFGLLNSALRLGTRKRQTLKGLVERARTALSVNWP